MECGDYEHALPRKTRESSRSLETKKAQVQKILDTLPDDASLEAIQYHIDLRQKIEQGWEERDRMHELPQRLADWLAMVFRSLTDRIARAAPRPTLSPPLRGEGTSSAQISVPSPLRGEG